MVAISVSGKKRPWLDLSRKISKGIAVEDAAIQLGIPMEEVYIYVSERIGIVDTLNFQLRLVGQAAIKSALTKLNELANGQQRISHQSDTFGDDHGGGGQSKSYVSDDLEAAKALAKFGVDALKLSKSGLAGRDDDKAQKDLFDLSHPDPWALKPIF